MTYEHVDVRHVRQGEWLAYIRSMDMTVIASSKPKVEYEAYRTIEECLGLKNFHVIYNDA